MFNFDKLRDRYLHDVEFHNAVDMMRALIIKHGFTLTEVRQVAFFACVDYELRGGTKLRITPDGKMFFYKEDSDAQDN